MNRKQALVQLIKHLNTETKTDDDDDVVQFGVGSSTLKKLEDRQKWADQRESRQQRAHTHSSTASLCSPCCPWTVGVQVSGCVD